ncbi:MAG: dihydrodipicolinate synthase family protein [Bacteroidales bacterium]|nr:dihydrodipicolinate synthase family protein [Bacteroidales bacterium]
MNRTETKYSLNGIVPPMITPLLDTNKLDIEGVRNLVEHLIKGGVHGIFILGTTGEAQHLSNDLKIALIKETCLAVNKRIPVLVGITDTSIIESIKLSEIAEKYGATAVVAAPPYFFKLGYPELEAYYKTLADKSPLPLYLYNMPSHTKTMLDCELVLELSNHKNIIGLKDSSANGVYFCDLLHQFRTRNDFDLFVGPEEMMASVVLLGGSGGVSGGANVYPKIFVDLYKAASKGDLNSTKEIQAKMMEVSSLLYGHGNYGSSYIKGIKTALELKGICKGIMAVPFYEFNKAEVEKVKLAITKLDKLIEE